MFAVANALTVDAGRAWSRYSPAGVHVRSAVANVDCDAVELANRCRFAVTLWLAQVDAVDTATTPSLLACRTVTLDHGLRVAVGCVVSALLCLICTVCVVAVVDVGTATIE